ncbi:MAG: hypothetical protein E7294_04085 [Lachnospiraceae bacterium]|nr:hypothetical protein [Lachnospiraceae bacterium]
MKSMKQEIRKRKRSFWAFMLSVAMMLELLTPMGAIAATYHAGGQKDTFDTGSYAVAGDTINFTYDGSNNREPGVNYTYYDRNGEVIDNGRITVKNPGTGEKEESSFIVKDYTGTAMDKADFKAWRVTMINRTGGCLLDIAFRAFSVKDHDITYECNGGFNSMDNPDYYTEGEGVERFFSAHKFVAGYPNGLPFLGWYSDPEFGEGTKVESIPPTATEDITLYAKFEGDTYKITYEPDGGTVYGENPSTYTNGIGILKGEKTSAFLDAYKDGYEFTGWYKKTGDGEVKVEEIPADWAGNITLYARYKACEYNITYELDGGTNSANNPDKYTYGVGVEKFEDAEKYGHTFEGWYEERQGTTAENSTVKVTAISDSQQGDIVLIAKYKPAEYKITYNLDGGTNGSGNPDKYTFGEGVESFADATKEGCTFEGWYVTARLADQDEEQEKKVTKIEKDWSGDITLNAKFKANEYPITYELDGGENGAGNPEKYTYGVGVKSFAAAKKEGYDFAGWYIKGAAAGPEEQLIKEISTTQTGEVVLYAKYTKKEEPKTVIPTKEEIKKNEFAINAKLRVGNAGARFSLRWGKVYGADGYEIYAGKAKGAFEKKPIIEAKANQRNAKISKVGGKKININQGYKFYIRAYKIVNGEKITLAESIPVFSISKKNAKWTNTKHTRIENKKITLQAGKTSKIKAKTVTDSSRKKLFTKVPVKEFRYGSTDEKVATVNASGTIKAVGKGTCLIWVYARNGNAQKVKVTVK